MTKLTRILLLCLPSSVFLYAQDRASMTSPVINTSKDEVIFSTEVSSFVPGADYRLGLGSADPKLTTVKIELLKNEEAVANTLVSFVQEHTSGWWDVDKVSVRGFVLGRDELPAKGEKLRLRVTLSREQADQFKKLYVLVARKYGENLWYLEDGVELTDSHW